MMRHMKHTKGPWKWGAYTKPRGEDGDFGAETKYQNCGLYGADGEPVIDLQVDHYEEMWEEYPSKDDARLIAAAPELAAIVNELGYSMPRVAGDSPRWNEVYAEARAIIERIVSPSVKS